MKHTKKIFTAVVIMLLSINVFAQWKIPAEAKKQTAPTENSVDAALAGKLIYDTKCKACHQIPGATGMKAPAPPDLGIESFLNKTDGEIFYQISEGMGGMPPFKSQLSEEDRWNIVHYLATGRASCTVDMSTALQNLELKVEIIDDKKQIKAIVSGGNVDCVKVGFFVKRYFGLLPIKVVETDSSGMVTTTFPNDISGDKDGNTEIVVKFDNPDRHGKAEVTKKIKWATPVHYINPLEKRAMWGVGAKAPLWILFSYIGITFSVWAVIIFVILQILKLKKAKNEVE